LLRTCATDVIVGQLILTVLFGVRAAAGKEQERAGRIGVEYVDGNSL
jgi:hypothetical protein